MELQNWRNFWKNSLHYFRNELLWELLKELQADHPGGTFSNTSRVSLGEETF